MLSLPANAKQSLKEDALIGGETNGVKEVRGKLILLSDERREDVSE